MRWRRAIALTIASMLGLIHPGHALALAGYTAAEDVPIAEAFWGGPPPQCTSVEFGTDPVQLDVGGEATQPEPGWFGPCVLELHEPQPGYLTREQVCLIAVHEEGHLHGFGHSRDPDNPMFPEVPEADGLPIATHIDPECLLRPPRHRVFARGARI